jgi:23S rRNA (cytidine1920-2'-O)/16S rRNA (cytidine1409-2'-O)-methyltransferase
MRLDLYLYERGYCSSRTEAKTFIEGACVSVNKQTITKPAFDIDENTDFEISVDKSGKKYVSRGGLKLEAALKEFSLSPSGKICIDVGASSGGFTDCLLKNGAERVFAVDSGHGQMNDVIRRDARVRVYEGYNARYMKREDFELVPSFAVMDVSFISASYILPALYGVLSEEGELVLLVKPQFEMGRAYLSKGGIVKNQKARKMALERVIDAAQSIGFKFISSAVSPIKGGDGNVEFLAHFKK